MKRLLLFALACTVVVFSLTGCKRAASEHPAGHKHNASEHPNR